MRVAMNATGVALHEAPATHWTVPGLAMNDLQANLRPLPLPLLSETLARYLSSCKPLLTPAEFAETQKYVANFATGAGPELQQLLERRAQQTAAEGSHWLSAWWEHFAYLSCRAPLPIKWNVFGTLLGCTAHADRHLRAARILHAFAEFYVHLLAGRLSPDVLDTRGSIPLCMRQYARLFASSRVPGEGVDTLVARPSTDGDAHHAAIFCEGHAYSLRLLRPADASSGGELRPVEVTTLAAGLASIDAHAARRGPSAHPLAALTALERDTWARARAATIESSTDNAAHVSRIEGSLVALTMDRASPSDVDELCAMSHEGGDGTSVWFDKPISLLTYANGRCGVNAEHAHFDAPVPARLFSYVSRRIASAEAHDDASRAPAAHAAGLSPLDGQATPLPATSASESWRPLDFTRLPAGVLAALAGAPAAFEETRRGNRLVPIRFEGGGRKEALPLRPLSADSLVQMALQLAQLRDQGELVATYESATTRRYAAGRTETIRSCSVASSAFARAMDDPAADRATRLRLLGAALKEHGDWLINCSSGRGVDRHLMGLRILAAGVGGPTPDIFTDPAYAKASTYHLSTSNTSVPGVGPRYDDIGGFGAPITDCYGVAYQIQEHSVRLMVTGDAKCVTRDARRFSKAVLQALADVFALVEDGAPEVLHAAVMGSKSKL